MCATLRPEALHARRAPASGRARRLLLSALLSACALACGGGGDYGFGRAYSPLSAEEQALAGAEAYDPVMARRLPAEWLQKKLHLFGVVLERDAGRDGLTDLTLSVRRLAARNLCETGDESSCRVTVSDHEVARTHVLVQLSKEDDVGKQRLQPRSLVRIVGQLQDQPHERDGNDVLLASYYRHWPPAFYVTNQAREYMRR
jgi:hypothetical protein